MINGRLITLRAIERDDVLIASLCPPCLLSVCSVSFPYQPTMEKPWRIACIRLISCPGS